MFFDGNVFWQTGRAFLERGANESLYPFPLLFWFFSLAARLPREVWFGLEVAVSLLLLVTIFKRRALLWMWYMPFLQTLAQGQLTIAVLALLLTRKGWAWALLTLKPQLFPLAIPQMVERWKDERRSFLVGLLALYLIPTLIRPNWPGEWWVNIQAHNRQVASVAASFWGLPILCLVVAIVLLLSRRFSWKALSTSFNPLLRAYDYGAVVTPSTSLWIVPFSWLSWLAMYAVEAAWPFAFLGLWGTIGFSAAEISLTRQVDFSRRLKSPLEFLSCPRA
jgi:hypothetical protein